MRVATSTLTDHIGIIEWTDDALGMLAYRMPFNHADIQYGAKLHVRDFQQALFMTEDQFADTFNPGLYTLTRENMPRLSVFKHWNDHYDNSFVASVFFIKTKFFIDQPWSLQKRHRSSFTKLHGTFDIKIINARKIIQKMMQEGLATYGTENAREMLEGVIERLLPDALKQSKMKSQGELQDNTEVSAFIQESINIELNDYGLLIRNLSIKLKEA